MKEFLVDIYTAILNFFTADLSLSPEVSKILAVVCLIVVVIVAVRLAVGLVRWIGNLIIGI